MALPALATVASMEVRLGLEVGTLTGADLARAEASLADASAFVRSIGRTLWLDTSGEVTAPEDVAMVTTRAAIRDYRNPDGVNNEALGQGAYAYAYAPGQASIWLTEDEVKLVRQAAANGGTPGAWTGTGSVYTPSAYTPQEGETGLIYPPWGGYL